MLISLQRFPLLLASILLVMGASLAAQETEPLTDLPRLGESLNPEQVQAFARLALAGLDTEYPNKPSNVLAGPDEVVSPRDLHPAFYGCFDWHSSVHGHWMLARLLRENPHTEIAPTIREALNRHLTEENLRKEVEYFQQPHHKSFERMYGWAWYLRLVTELEGWDDADGERWREALRPLEDWLVERTLEYLPKLEYPIRTGVHPNTAFAMGQALDYARQIGNASLDQLLCQRARDYFANDRDYPTRYEPSGEDFFSPAWNEVDLMRRVLSAEEFPIWLEQFLPGLATGETGALLIPVEVSDVTDGKLVHLAGLNLSRAWCLAGIVSALPAESPLRAKLTESADAHLAAGLRYVFSGHYEGEHWLATFAVYAIRRVGCPAGSDASPSEKPADSSPR